MTIKQAYTDKMTAQLGLAEAEIERLKAKAELADADVKLSIQKQVDDMQQRYAEAHSLLADVKASGDHAWEDIKFGVDAAWQDLRKSVENASKHF